MKILLKTPQNNYSIWVELNNKKGYFDLIHEIRMTKSPCLVKDLKIVTAEGISSRLIPYLLGLDLFKACWVYHFLNRDKDLKERISFLIEHYPDWAFNEISLANSFQLYEREKAKSFWQKHRQFFLNLIDKSSFSLNQEKKNY
jgi:hypothetical protein